ncbi:MAG: EAL domain-containing protein [Gammaproteobacteria bacterium]|nr:EAL domain-containing protein [Gammaproteobacteria bacterium]
MSEEITTPGRQTHFIGIGASAGGLEALSQFVANLSLGLDCIYVIAQHMSPSHRSMMAEILARETALEVKDIREGESPQKDVVYVIPPGFNLVLQAGVFHLIATAPEISPKPSINMLFQSIAEEYDEHAIGIILSGTGSDGTSGLRAIKAAGGITIAQIPESAKYEGMPRSAIDAGVVDRILAPDQIGRELERLNSLHGLPNPEEIDQRQPSELTHLFNKVRHHTRIDFSSYKLSTVMRRLQRRILTTNCENLKEYVDYVEENPGELDALAKETLISVTEFFRDREAFLKLEKSISELVKGKEDGEEIRVWVMGCATGEEAYSIAILFAEQLGERFDKQMLQIFATDIDNDALAIARRGIYNHSAVSEMPKAYLQRYFHECSGGFEPIKDLRDSVVFARQDVVVDPPFLRVDLISCRNVLIYFNADLQAKVLSLFHYALRDNGLLFLGRSENVSQQEYLFSALDRRTRLFRRRSTNQQRSQQPIAKLLKGQLTLNKREREKPEKSYERIFLDAITAHYAPAALLVDGNFRIYFSQGAVSHFLNFPKEQRDMNLGDLIVPEFKSEVITVFHRAHNKEVSSYSRYRRIASLDHQTWRFAIHPVGGRPGEDLYLVAFEGANPEVDATAGDAVVEELSSEEGMADELVATREHLQTLIEEMAASNEEMQALNEEVQASNEELQATNEELEASNEELQAANEELISINEESHAKSSELVAMNSDFESLYNTLDFPVLVFDVDFHLKRANAAASRLFDLPTINRRIHIQRISFPPHLADISSRLDQVLQSSQKVNYIATVEDRSYQVMITPAISHVGVPQSLVLVVMDQSQILKAQAQIRESQEKLLAIMNHSTSIISLKDTSGCYEFVNLRFEELFDLKSGDILGKSDRQIFPTAVAKLLRDRDLETMGKLDLLNTTDEIVIDESSTFLETTRFPIYDASGVVRSICTQATNVTHRQHAEEQLRLAAKVFDRAGEAILITNAEGLIITVNGSFTRITGYEVAEVIGKSPSLLKSGVHGKPFYDEMWRSLSEQGWWQGEIINQRKDGKQYHEWLTINSVQDGDGSVVNYVAIFSDISAIKSSQRKIEFLATHDELTGLPNRGLLIDRIKHGISQMKRQHKELAVLFMDLDNFKRINDSLGHDVGDILLKESSQRLLRCVRDSDTVARLGGDEFVALLMDVDLDEINVIASRIVELLSASFNIREQRLFVSVSIGVSIFPNDGEESVTLLKNADTAMYRAKERGRNQYQFFADEMKVVALQRMTLESGLRYALDHNALSLVYQPKILAEDGTISSAEALLRWEDRNLGKVSPLQFIPVAENCGLIGAVGERVLQMVVAQIISWQAAGFTVPRIYINVSAHQFRDHSFAHRLQEVVAENDLPPSAIGIEVTESLLMKDPGLTSTILSELCEEGVSISVDDFGTGYSSLSYLKKLNIHELKVDKSFIDGIADDHEDQAIVRAIVSMAQALDLKTVAEGVETAEQMEILKEIGITMIQGYYYYRPQSPQAFGSLLVRKEKK